MTIVKQSLRSVTLCESLHCWDITLSGKCDIESTIAMLPSRMLTDSHIRNVSFTLPVVSDTMPGSYFQPLLQTLLCSACLLYTHYQVTAYKHHGSETVPWLIKSYPQFKLPFVNEDNEVVFEMSKRTRLSQYDHLVQAALIAMYFIFPNNFVILAPAIYAMCLKANTSSYRKFSFHKERFYTVLLTLLICLLRVSRALFPQFSQLFDAVILVSAVARSNQSINLSDTPSLVCDIYVTWFQLHVVLPHFKHAQQLHEQNLENLLLCAIAVFLILMYRAYTLATDVRVIVLSLTELFKDSGLDTFPA